MVSPEEQRPRGRRILFITAHPDDSEFGAAGSAAKWAREGREVHYCIVTNGDKGSSDPEASPEQVAALRAREQRAACDTIGGQELIILGYPDGTLQNTLDVRRDIVRVIRRLKPDVVVCQDPTVRFRGNSINHPDHRAAGDAALDAVFPSARDHLVFPELLAEGLRPHKVTEVLLMGTAEPDLYIDITDTIDIKIAALQCHASQVNGRDVAKFVRERAQQLGHSAGYEYAEAFRYISLQ